MSGAFAITVRQWARLLGPSVLVSFVFLLGASSAAAMTVTSTGETGACTLRGAIEAVNTNNSATACGSVSSGGLTPINLPANIYTPSDGQLQVTSGAQLEIIGASINDPASTVIDATGPGRVFEILSGAQVKLTGLKVTGGQTANGTNGTSYGQYGGPAGDGGGILNKGSLSLDHVLVTANFTGDGGNGADGVSDAQSDGKGGGLGGRGGGIYNNAGAYLSVTASTISANGTGGGGDGGAGGIGVNGLGHYPQGGHGGAGGPPGSGGGIYNAGSATITTSTLSGNFTGRGGNGGNGGQGAGPAPAPNGGTFSSGRGGYGGDGGSASYSRNEYCQCYQPNSILGGGGIANVEGGSLTMTASTVSANNTGAGGNGGGAGIGGPDSNGHSVTGSTGGFAGSGGVGAGLWTSYGTSILTNVTFSGNFTGDGGVGGNGPTSGSLGPGPGGYGGDGGAIWSYGARSPYYVQLTHVTISKNSLGDAGPPGAPGAPPEGSDPYFGIPGVRGKGSGISVGGRYDPSGASVYLKNTIIANNGLVSDANCVDSGASPTNYFDQGGNLTWGGTTCPGISADPILGLLQDNGGPTLTMEPQPGSAAIGAISSACSSVPTDQRGYPRPGSGSSCDIGAVETGSAPALTPTTTAVSTSTNPATVGQAVTLTSTVSPPPGAGTVTFTDNGTAISGCSAKSLNGSGQATCLVTFSATGSHPIVAGYTGTSVYKASTSPTLNQVVQSQQGGGPGPGGGSENGAGGGGSPGNVVGAGGSTPPAVTAPVKPKARKCPKSKKRVVVKGKVKCVPKRKRKHNP